MYLSFFPRILGILTSLPSKVQISSDTYDLWLKFEHIVCDNSSVGTTQNISCTMHESFTFDIDIDISLTLEILIYTVIYV
jgi:hypothetical protein